MGQLQASIMSVIVFLLCECNCVRLHLYISKKKNTSFSYSILNMSRYETSFKDLNVRSLSVLKSHESVRAANNEFKKKLEQ